MGVPEIIQLWSQSFVVIFIGGGSGVFLAACAFFLLHRRKNGFLKFGTASLLREHIQRLNGLQDYRDLYPAVLEAISKMIGATGVSLILRDAKDGYQVKSYLGPKPLTFDISQVESFLKELEKRRVVVTREMLCVQPSWMKVKHEGLRYSIQQGCEACVPLYMGDRFFGLINLSARTEGRYDRKTCDVLELLSAQFSVVLYNGILYQQLVRQNRHLKEMGVLKNQMLANFSHELRTPLTTVIGLSEVMAEGAAGPVNEEQRRYLISIQKGASRLFDLVTSMVELSKIESNQMVLNVQKVDLKRLIGEVMNEVPIKEQIHVSVELDSTTPGVYGDEFRLKELFKHLLENASKFTPRGRITIRAEKSGEMLRICIVDTGIGIARSKQKQIFDLFHQIDGSSTREHQGLGVGLSISRRIVELHGGRLWLVSRVGRGSRFFFTLPLKPVGVRDPMISRCA